MKNLAKLLVTAVFAIVAVALVLSGSRLGDLDVLAQTANPTPTPAANANAKPANANTAANVSANTATTGGKTIPKTFILGKDSLTEYGEAPFDHDTHAFKNYSPDGKSVVGCVECHHTDQPKSALKPPLLTSERDVALTMDVWRASSKKVSGCRDCHFQEGNVPDGKEMPTADYTIGGKTVTKDLNNENAYHLNCNTCHDAAAALRPEVKSRTGFATSKDCLICHKKN
ncbi:MAG: cytochrome c3 family protein [Pyrinomonadaceae bacterium]